MRKIQLQWPWKVIKLKKAKDDFIILGKHDILSSLAYCAVQQSPYTIPKNLNVALEAVSNKIDALKVFKSVKKNSYNSYGAFTSNQLYDLIDLIVKDVPEVSIWNVSQRELDSGIKSNDDPNRKVKFVFVSRYDYPAEDCDFIDLDALSRNVFNNIIDNQ